MIEYAFDTNTIVHLMRGTKSVHENRVQAQTNGARFIISRFVHYEVQRGLLIKPIFAHEKAYAVICDNCSVENMNDDVWQCASQIYADLYKKRFTVSDADILIAAFCIVNDYILVTDNIKDFENIDGLQLINWVA